MKQNRIIGMVLALAFAMLLPMAAFADGGTGAGGSGGKPKGDGSGNGGGGKIGLSIEVSNPEDGETGVALNPEINLSFTHNVVAGKLAESNLALLHLETADGQPVEIEAWVGDEATDPALRTQLFMKPKAELAPETKYVVRVGAGLAAKNGMVTKEELTVTFTTAKTVVPAEPTQAPEVQPTEAPEEVPAEGTADGKGVPVGAVAVGGVAAVAAATFGVIAKAKHAAGAAGAAAAAVKPGRVVKVKKKK